MNKKQQIDQFHFTSEETRNAARICIGHAERMGL